MEERNLRKTRVGVVVSDKMDKTIVVAVKDSVQHPLYKKILKRTAKFKARDEQNGLTINRFRADCGSCSEEIVEEIEKHSKSFYIRAKIGRAHV